MTGVLPPCMHRGMCLRYASLETSLGEIDRARAVYSHGSEISDPRVSRLGALVWPRPLRGRGSQ